MRLRSSDPASDDDLPEEVSLAVAKQAELARVRQQRQSKASRKRKTPHSTVYQEPAAAQANPVPPKGTADQPANQPGAEEDSDELPAHLIEELMQRRRQQHDAAGGGAGRQAAPKPKRERQLKQRSQVQQGVQRQAGPVTVAVLGALPDPQPSESARSFVQEALYGHQRSATMLLANKHDPGPAPNWRLVHKDKRLTCTIRTSPAILQAPTTLPGAGGAKAKTMATANASGRKLAITWFCEGIGSPADGDRTVLVCSGCFCLHCGLVSRILNHSLCCLPHIVAIAMAQWEQVQVKLPAKQRGCHLVTDQIERQCRSELARFDKGLANIFIQHTSASLTINENCDPDVRTDMETFLSQVVPEGRKAPWIHTAEGDDDMPAHCKSSMFGCSLNIPITDGRFNLGTWQGIWMCEHRDQASSRRIVVTLQGSSKSQR